MTSRDPHDPEHDEAYRALGRWFFEFSRLMYHMRVVIERCLSGKHPQAAQLALGEATAAQISNSFFGICRALGDLDDEDEVPVAAALQKAVRNHIEDRNDYAHGDWWIGFGRTPEGSMSDPFVRRIKPHKVAGPLSEKELPVDKLDAESDSMWELLQQVAEFGAICTKEHPFWDEIEHLRPPRVKDIFVARKGQVFREGPLAHVYRMRFS